MVAAAAAPIWSPHDGPQRTFLESAAYEVLYGGQAGGGKSDALLYGGLRQVAHPAYKALILRRTFPELRELIDRSLMTFSQAGGSWNQVDHRWTFPSGATYQFGYCSTYAEVMQYQGQQFTWIGFDEIGQLAEERVWLYLMSRNRTSAPGLHRMMRASANPGGPGHQWIKRRFISRCPPDGTPVEIEAEQAGLKGARTTTRAFVKATLRDNPALMGADPDYESRLALLPDLEFRWLALGDWDAGAGLGLQELQRDKHTCPPMENVETQWVIFGGFDWGYEHPFSYGIFAYDGYTVYLLDTVHGRHLQPPDIALRILDRLQAFGIAPSRLRYTTAGHDCWADIKSRSERVPTIAEEFAKLGMPLRKANVSRIAGVQNIRRYLRWKARDALDGQEREIRPYFQICNTPGNARTYDCLESRISDPDDPEDILKTNADHRGEGGDDPYDMVRYGLASRPLIPSLQAFARTQKIDDIAPHFDLEKRRLERVSPAADLDDILRDTGRPKNAAPVAHRIPRRPR